MCGFVLDEEDAVAKRMSGAGARKSLWEGGSKGAQKRGSIQNLSGRGLRAERESQGSSFGVELKEMTLNPGLV